jgi:hypothetical protein
MVVHHSATVYAMGVYESSGFAVLVTRCDGCCCVVVFVLKGQIFLGSL